MQKINPLLEQAGKALKRVSAASQTAAGQSEAGDESTGFEEPQGQDSYQGRNEPDLVDAINQLFTEFELAYHNQYYKAYSSDDRLILAKKYWLRCLDDFSPLQIVAAGHQLVRKSDYLPTVAAVVKACEEGTALFGLPSPREAYFEACRAPAPKISHAWSHQAVYLAGRAADWYLLATEPEEKAFPVFRHYYQHLCQRAMRGEELDKPLAPALVHNPPRPLPQEEQQRRMAALRDELDL